MKVSCQFSMCKWFHNWSGSVHSNAIAMSRRPCLEDNPEIKYYNLYYSVRLDSLIIKNNILPRKWESNDGSTFKLLLVIPNYHREMIVKQLHNWKAGAHYGVKETLH